MCTQQSFMSIQLREILYTWSHAAVFIPSHLVMYLKTFMSSPLALIWKVGMQTANIWLSRVLQRNSERKARELANEFGIDIVTIHPAMVVGPILSAAKGGFSINSVKVIYLVSVCWRLSCRTDLSRICFTVEICINEQWLSYSIWCGRYLM